MWCGVVWCVGEGVVCRGRCGVQDEGVVWCGVV